MQQTLNCPSCGAAVEYPGTGRTINCPYCATSIQVPQELWQPVEDAQTADRWKKYLIIFLIVTVGLPTCLGFLGTALGIGAGIFGAILPFILKIFIH